MSNVFVLGLLCCLLLMAPASSNEASPSPTVSPAPAESDILEDSDSIRNVSLANFSDTLNDMEQRLVLRHPIQAARAALAASKAEEMTVQMYGYNGWQDNADAFRHCLWNALMKKSMGEDAAKEWANAHEYTSEGMDREMDLFNNEVGRGIDVSEMDEDQIVGLVKELVSTGRCLRIVDGHLESTN